MRSRSNSVIRLDHYYNMVYETILHYQDPVTGLLPAYQVTGSEHHAWVRDNVYSVSAVWALALAYRRVHDKEDEKNKLFQLEQAAVKCMRGILMAMMGQRDKVEKFKRSFSSFDSLHAKYSSRNGQTVVGDKEWGHLQIDAVSLYLLFIAQMTASGLQIVFTLDEVAFVQNLVFYIECAYVTPDYGIWERGDKSNQSIVELNASSIGMAKAALEAMNKLDLFGGRGGPPSEIHVLPDEAVKCAAVLESMLPRESNSKETDAAILSIIGFPAFAVPQADLVAKTLSTIQEKLGGRFGMKRFLRDGYKTAIEDPTRLHYEPWELRLFENIECEWPLFFCYLVINYCFQGEEDLAKDVMVMLDTLTVEMEGFWMVPELYKVPEDKVGVEYANPGKADREVGGRCPFMWAQSLYIIAKLLHEEFIAPGELDPMNRRLSSLKKPDVVVQVVVLAEDSRIQNLLKEQDLIIPTCAEIAPIQVQPSRMLSHLYTFLGRSSKLGLSGRRSLDVGILATSKIYRIQDKSFVFTPQSFDRSMNYTDTDPSLAMSTLAYGLNYLATSWTDLGRPTMTLILSCSMLEDDGTIPVPMVNTLKKLKSGYINGTRVSLGTYEEFHTTSSYSELAFLGNIEAGCPDRLDPVVAKYLETQLGGGVITGGILGTATVTEEKKSANHCVGTVKRTRSIIMSESKSKEVAAKLIEKHETRKRDLSVSRSPGSSPGSTKHTIGESFRRRLGSDISGRQEEAGDLVKLLQTTRDMEEQGDILHYMAEQFGLMFKVNISKDGEDYRTVENLVQELYDASCEAKNWAMVRHTSGLLGKKLPSLALSLTDLIVRQKQVTVGLPGKEIVITRPVGAQELRLKIVKAHEGDVSTSSLSQEILLYLAMFIRTEPYLFTGMLRLRVGLIIQVMNSELGRTLSISPEEAEDKLLNLSPYETKNLLHHIMSGQEYGIREFGSRCSIYALSTSISRNHQHTQRLLVYSLARLSQIVGLLTSVAGSSPRLQFTSPRLQVYSLVYLSKITGLLTSLSLPDYRQLIVEAILVLILIVDHNVVSYLGGIINVENIVNQANEIFLEDQRNINGDSFCCAQKAGKCGGSGGICCLFYDSAPSGTYGTISYLVRSACRVLETIPNDGEIDCNVM
ncbi:probable phosphorylase b kinase regulatory subunit alpha [Eurytemora carolleeae]|uniref:probable phosphorylase b kinase regulatory subunit alpha n=1 Tax=Eurytemora carolleeae TaxID=1294199 RepID=UPI000C78A0E4|nr:probable phosphorylase b kinase regulatory subunit alpha [Eurytemora carolleeae]|eukprot:XP_023325881.1 probable phosphorylase b kinase regulatory subunit alpha [Eurytemora affinis]